MDEKKLKNIAKRIKELIPLAKAAVYEATVEERRALRNQTGDKTFKLSNYISVLRNEDRRTRFIEEHTRDKEFRNMMELARRERNQNK